MSRDDLLQKLNEYLGPDGWEDLPEAAAEQDGCTLRTWRREATNATSFFLKCEQIFPDIDHEQFYDILSDVEERTKWDDRWIDAVIVEKNEEPHFHCIIYMKGRASPIPGLFSQRDMIYSAFQK